MYGVYVDSMLIVMLFLTRDRPVLLRFFLLFCFFMSVSVHAKNLRLGMGDQLDSDQGAFALHFKELLENSPMAILRYGFIRVAFSVRNLKWCRTRD